MQTRRPRPGETTAHGSGNVVSLRAENASGVMTPATGRADLDALDDHRLIVLCRAGDEQAWKALVVRYQRLVYSIPLRAGLDADEADDVFLETYARLLEHLGRLKRPRQVRAWLVTTARRLSLDVLGYSGRMLRCVSSSAEVADPRRSVLEEIERVSERDLVHRALRRLGVRCQQLLDMLYGLSRGRPRRYREVADRLDLPIGSIGPTRARCLDSLRIEMRRVQLERPVRCSAESTGES